MLLCKGMGRGLRKNAVYALSRGLSAWDRFRPHTADIASIRNFLLLPHYAALGPQVLLTAFLRALQASVPEARIALAAGSSVGELCRHAPEIERIVEVPSPVTDLFGCIRAVRAAKFFNGEPFAVALPIGTSSPMHRTVALCIGASAVVDLGGVPKSSTSLAYDRQLSRIANDFRLISALGHEDALRARLREDPSLWEPRMHVPAEEQTVARRLLQEAGVPEGAPYAVLVTQTRPSPPRRWRPEFFRRTAEWMYRTHGLHVVFVGAPVDSAAIQRLREPLECPSADLSGKTSLRELAAVLRGARIGLCLDTGAMHMARAVNLPMVVIAPTSEQPMEWLPHAVPHVHVLYNTHMRAEDWAELPGELQPGEVQAQLQELLHTFGGSSDAEPVR